MDKENSPLTTSRGRRVNVVQADRAPGKGDAKAAASKAPKAEKAKPAEKVSKELKTKAPPAPKAAAEKVAKKDLPAATHDKKAPAPCPLCGSLTPFCAMTGKAHSVPKAPKVSKQALPAATAAVSIVDDDDEDAAISSLLVQPAPVPAVGIKRARSAKPTAANGQTPTTQKRRTEGKTSAAAPAVVSSDDEDTPLIALASVEVLEPPPSSTGPKKRGTTQTTLNFKKSEEAGVIPPPPVKPFKPVFNKISSTLARSIFLDALDTKGKADGGGKTADEGEADVDGEANESSITGAAAISSTAAAATKVDKVRTSRAYLSFVFDFMSERSKYEIVRAEMNKNGGSLPDKYAKRVRAAPAATHAPKGPVKGGGVSIATMLNKQGSSGSIAGDNKAASPVKQGSNPSPIKKQVSTTKNASPAKNPEEEGSVPMVVGDGNGAGAVAATTPKKAGGKRSRSATSASPTNQK